MAHPNQITARTTINACTSLTGWAAIAGSIALAAPPDARYGTTPVLKLTSAVATAAYCDLTLNQTLTGRLGFLLYVEPWDVGAGSTQNTKSMTIYVSNDSGYTNYYYKGFVARSGWQYVMFDRAENGTGNNEDSAWRINGSPTWANAMVRIRVRIESQTGSATNVYVAGVFDAEYYKPQFIVEFDDNLASAYSVAFPIMQALGIKGTMNVIGSKVGVAGYCTLAQLQEMYAAGWDMCNHTWSHIQNSYYGGTYQYCYDEIVNNKNYLIENGFTRSNCHLHFAAPYGESTYREASAYRQAIADTCTTGRCTVERGTNAQFVDDPVLLNILLPDGSAETLQQQIDRLNMCIGAGGTCRILFHDIVTPADTQIKWTPTNFQSLMNWLYLQRQANVADLRTWTEHYERIKNYNAMTNIPF